MAIRKRHFLLPVLVALAALFAAGPSVYPYASALVGRWGSGATETDDIRIDASTNSLQVIDYAHHEVHAGSHYYLEGHTTLAADANMFVSVVTPDTAKWSHFTWEITSSGILYSDLYEGPSGGMAGGARAVIHANNRNVNCWTGSHTAAGNNATVMTDSTQAWTIDALIDLQVFNVTDGSSALITDNDVNTITVAALAGGTDNDWDTSDTYEINNSQMVITSGIAVPTTWGVQISNHAAGGTGFKSVSGGSQSRDDEIVLKRNTTYLRYFQSGSADNIISFHASWYEHEDKN